MKTIFGGRHLIFAVYARPSPVVAYNSHKSPSAFLHNLLLGIQPLALANTSHASLTCVNSLTRYIRTTEMSKIKHIHILDKSPWKRQLDACCS